MNEPPDVRQRILDVAHPLMVSKGFTAVGLAEILAAAKVPKGSFYHYFASKEAFGQAILDSYFLDSHAHTDTLLEQPGPASERLMAYFQYWLESQTAPEEQNRCLVVKLAAEVSDLSEHMRGALDRGTRGIIERLARCIEAGRADGSVRFSGDAGALAEALYQRWLGAGLMSKISASRTPFDAAIADTRQLLGMQHLS